MKQEQITIIENAISKDYSNMTGMVIMKDGKIIYEKYFNGCTEADHIHISSATKSVFSILLGIALDKGYIKSIDQKVLDFYPEYTIKRGENTIQSITLKDILTMTAPYKYKYNPYTKYFSSEDWVKFSLDMLGGKGRIGEFRYAPIIGPDILSDILMKTTTQPVLYFAKKNLFEPLGIMVDNNVTFRNKEEYMAFYKATDVSGWVASPTGVNTAGWGLTLSSMDMAKIGQLLLNKGVWNGKRIVSAKWINESTSEQSRWKQRNLPYGFFWWIDDQNNSFAAIGDGGNIIYVSSDKNMVVAITSLFQPKAKDRIEFIKQYVFPIFDEKANKENV
ncbi:MAG: serine hydrolase domain-containing protein [Oscillospiraceae bacterium]